MRRSTRLASIFALLLPAAPAVAQRIVPVRTATEDLRIGGADDPDADFSPGVELAVGPGGSIYVLDRQNNRVRVFDAGGKPVRGFGRKGPGPGEFQGAETFGWLGDTLWVSDPAQYRVSLFRADGSLIRTHQIATRVSPLYSPRTPVAMLADGTGLTIPYPPAHLALEGAVQRIPIVRVDRRGVPVDTLAWHPVGLGAFEVLSGESTVYLYQPLRDAPEVVAAPDGRGIVIVERTAAERASGAHFRVTRLTARGDTIYSRRYRYTPTPIPSGFQRERAAKMGADLASRHSGVDRQQVVSRIAAQLYVSPFFPPITAVVYGRDGTVWLRREQGEAATVVWHMLDQRGEIGSSFRLPKDLMVKQASRTHLWCVTWDDLDVPYVVRYRINAPPRRR